MEIKKPWYEIEDNKKQILEDELVKELNPNHVLYGKIFSIICRRYDCDDFAYQINDNTGRYAIVHLTWKHPDVEQWPSTEIYKNIEDLYKKIESDCKIEGELFEE
jgi:hypothetical protein